MRSFPRATARTLPLAALAVVALACDGDRGPLQVRQDAFTWIGAIAPGNAVRIRELQGAIEVSPSADDSVRVTARVEWRRGDPDEALSFTGTRVDGDLLVCAMWSGGTCTKDSYNANIRRGPNSTDAKVYFRVQVPAGVSLDLVNINGDISAAASAPVLARTVNGDVVVATAVGPVEAKTMNGSVDIRMASVTGTDSVKAETMNGSVYVYLPDSIDAVVDMAVTNGAVSTEFPVTVQGTVDRRKMRFTLGQGTRAVHMRTLNGEVALRRLAAVEGAPEP